MTTVISISGVLTAAASSLSLWGILLMRVAILWIPVGIVLGTLFLIDGLRLSSSHMGWRYWDEGIWIGTGMICSVFIDIMIILILTGALVITW